MYDADVDDSSSPKSAVSRVVLRHNTESLEDAPAPRQRNAEVRLLGSWLVGWLVVLEVVQLAEKKQLGGGRDVEERRKE